MLQSMPSLSTFCSERWNAWSSHTEELGEMRGLADQHVVLLSGPIASGKTTLAQLLVDRLGFCIVSTRALLLRYQGEDRRSLQAAGASLDDSAGGRWVRDGLVRWQRRCSAEVSFVVDSVRTIDQIRWVREAFGEAVMHVHLIADVEVLADRYCTRFEGYEYQDVSDDPVERGVNVLAGSAELVVDTSRSEPELVLEKVAGRLGLVP